MANEEQLKILLQGVDIWNVWREEHLGIVVDLSEADLTEVNLTEVDLAGANLYKANLTKANLTGADLRYAQLDGARLIEAELRETRLRNAELHRADLSKATLVYADCVDADLTEADMTRADCRWAQLVRANLSRVNLSDSDLRGVVLMSAMIEEANLARAKLSRAYLAKANLSKANLRDVDLREANLIETNLDRATLTNTHLWESQRAGWSIQGIICEAAYWDKDRKERTTYSLGEFERLYADKTKIVLHYEGGISPIEVATLPALIQQIEATHPGCILRLQSVQEDAGGATVTLVVEDGGGRNPDELHTLKADIEMVSQRAMRTQRVLLEERRIREQIETELHIVYDKIVPQIMRQAMEKSPSIQISGGIVYGNVVGEVSGENAQVHYTHNDLAALEALVSEMLTHRAELPLTSAERTQFEEKLNAIQEQLAAQGPNHSLLREALHSMRHILEAGVAHVLVGEWLPLLHKLG